MLEHQAAARRESDTSGRQARQTPAAAEQQAAARREALGQEEWEAQAASLARQAAARRKGPQQAATAEVRAAPASGQAPPGSGPARPALAGNRHRMSINGARPGQGSKAGRANMSAPVMGLLNFFASGAQALILSSQVSSRPSAFSHLPLLAGRLGFTALRKYTLSLMHGHRDSCSASAGTLASAQHA